MKSRLRITLLVALLAGIVPMPARAQGIVPNMVSYQGRITIDSEPYNERGSFKFAIVDGIGRTKWSNDGTSADGNPPDTGIPLDVRGGLFSVLLGDPGLGMEALTVAAVEDPQSMLRVWFSVDGDWFQQLSPDRPFATVPYAHLSNVAAWAHDADTLDGLQAADLAPRTHGHWGATWEGDVTGLKLKNTGSLPAEVTLSDQGDGMVVHAAASDGLRVSRAAHDGVQIGLQYPFAGGYDGPGDNAIEIWQAGSPPTHTMPSDLGFADTHDGVGIAGAEGFGVWVGYAGQAGVRMQEAETSGVHVEYAGTGYSVRSSTFAGVSIEAARGDGVRIGDAGDRGLYIYDVANAPQHNAPSDLGYSEYGHGTSIEGANEFGHFVGFAGQDGLHVNRASRDGVHVGSAGRYAVYAGGDVHVEGDLTWERKESHLSIPCSAFEAWDFNTEYINNGQSMWTERNRFSLTCDYYNAPLLLPQGSVVKRVVGYFYVTEASDSGPFGAECGDVEISLDRFRVGTYEMETLADGEPVGPTGGSAVLAAHAVPAEEVVIDHTKYAYGLGLKLPWVDPDTPGLFTKIRFLHVQVEYESVGPY